MIWPVVFWGQYVCRAGRREWKETVPAEVGFGDAPPVGEVRGGVRVVEEVEAMSIRRLATRMSMTVFGAPGVLDFWDYGFGRVGIGERRWRSRWAWVEDGFGDLLISCATVSMSICRRTVQIIRAPAAAKAKADVSSGAGDRDGLSFLAVDMAVWMDIRVSGVPGCEG